jgi:hypothetical protein
LLSIRKAARRELANPASQEILKFLRQLDQEFWGECSAAHPQKGKH